MNDLLQSSSRYILKISSGLIRQLDSFVEGSSMTPQEARALQFIAVSEKAIYQKDLETEYGCTAATISELIGNMEKKGLIRRETDPDDHRRKRLSVNPAIGLKVRDMVKKMAEMEKKLTEGIDEEKIRIFLEVAKQMSENIPPSGGK